MTDPLHERTNRRRRRARDSRSLRTIAIVVALVALLCLLVGFSLGAVSSEPARNGSDLGPACTTVQTAAPTCRETP